MSQPKYTSLPVAFDATQVQPAVPFEALPGGKYPAEITDGEIKPSGTGTNLRCELEFTVVDGPFKGRKVFDGFNYQHENAQTQEISQRQLSAISHSINVLRWQDVQELFRKPFLLQVKVEPGRWVDGQNKEVPVPVGLPAGQPPPGAVKFYEAKNRFQGAQALDGSAPAGGSSAAAPAWAKAPAAAPAAASPAAAPASATPPWAKAPASAAAPAPVAAATAKPAAPAPAAAPAGPKAPAKKKEPERTFFVLLPDGTVQQPAVAESKVAEMIAGGMPLDTMVNPGVEDAGWKPAGEYGFTNAPAPAAAPAAATAAGAPVAPPWARK